jgi:hypothetical protein
VLRHPHTGAKLSDVLMLLDSGADVTLIARASAMQVGATVEPGSAYVLVGFDGSSSTAEAVQLDLVFLKRAFKGRFLLTDQPCGVLGRDVLNHLAVLLDGPNLSWTEKP